MGRLESITRPKSMDLRNCPISIQNQYKRQGLRTHSTDWQLDFEKIKSRGYALLELKYSHPPGFWNERDGSQTTGNGTLITVNYKLLMELKS
jgi:hypothetical protein